MLSSLSALALRLFDGLDVLAVTGPGGSTAAAGHNGPAQNWALLPSLLARSSRRRSWQR